MEKVAVEVTPLSVAVTFTLIKDAAGVVLTLNVAVVAPPATVTLAGTVALALLDASATTNPPAGAAFVRVTVPTGELPPTTDLVFSVNVPVIEPSAVIVRVALC